MPECVYDSQLWRSLHLLLKDLVLNFLVILLSRRLERAFLFGGNSPTVISMSVNEHGNQEEAKTICTCCPHK